MKDISQLIPDCQAFDRAVVAGLFVAVDNVVKKTKLRARLVHGWKDRTYATRASIDGAATATSKGADGSLWAGLNAARLNDGTRAHIIEVRRKKALRFVQNGVVRFAKSVRHPGTKPDPFLNAAQDFAGEEIDRAVGAMLDGLL